MCGTRSADITTYPSADALPAEAAQLFGTAGTLFSTQAWWRTVLTDATPSGAQPRFVVCRSGDVTGLFPMLLPQENGLRGFTTPYTCEYAPLVDGDAAFETFGRFCRGYGMVRLDAVPDEWPHWDAMLAALRATGLVPRRFDHFGNWHEDVTGLGWTDYLAGRPGALRETIRRRLRRAERLAGAVFLVVSGMEGLEKGIAAFEDVYARSWKEPEPFPAFNAALMRTAAALGILRLGLWLIDGAPVAVQFWIVEHGRATVLKLAHDEAHKAHSPGTVLTALMLRQILDHETVREIDFGRGEDPYKRDWASQRRQRFGLLILNPRRATGLTALVRHDLGHLRRWWQRAEAT